MFRTSSSTDDAKYTDVDRGHQVDLSFTQLRVSRLPSHRAAACRECPGTRVSSKRGLGPNASMEPGERARAPGTADLVSASFRYLRVLFGPGALFSCERRDESSVSLS